MALAYALCACGPTGPDHNHNNNLYNNNNTNGGCAAGTTQCTLGNEYQTCQSGQWVTAQVCSGTTPACTNGVGCTACAASVNYCQGNQVWSCTAQGTPGTLQTTCGSGEDCEAGACTSPCLRAEATKSYVGCDYWPTPTANSQLADAFLSNFGVAVHNDNDANALVTIELGGTQVAQQDIPAHTLYTFQLDIDTGLKLTYGAEQSVQVPGSAYHLTSTLPVTVYQFNPLDFEMNVDSSLCPVDDYYGLYPPCHSYSNDASLLLPTYVLTGNYIVMARQTFGVSSSYIPGFMAIVGTENNTSVTVNYTANTEGGDVAAASPNSTATYTINRGEVLQVVSAMPTSCSGGNQVSDGLNTYCDMGANYDLTGTQITATAPVAVFGGHNCSFVPFDHYACDHLEEQIMPLETWGKEFIVGRTEPQAPSGTDPEPNVVRIVSGADANTIQLTPAQMINGTSQSSITLNTGKWVEFEASDHFHVLASGAIMIGQFLVGQDLYAPANYEYWGDPAYSLMVPTEQFRTQYTFLAPSTITYNYVNIVKRVIEGSAPVYLDGSPVSESAFSMAIGGTEWGVANVAITGTFHTIESTQPFGITVYGFANYTSYSYPGGLDLQFINPVN